MQKRSLFKSLVAVLAAIVSCSDMGKKSSNPPQYPQQRNLKLLNESKLFWDSENIKSYTYVVKQFDASSEQEAIAKNGWETTITVKNTTPVKRVHRVLENGKVSVKWEEEGEDLDSHNEGFAALSMEQLYEKCEELLRSNTYIAFDLKDKMLHSCYPDVDKYPSYDLISINNFNRI